MRKLVVKLCLLFIVSCINYCTLHSQIITRLSDVVGNSNSIQVADDNFGYSIVTEGDLVVVGVPNQDYDSNSGNFATNAGAVYVFSKDEGGTDKWGIVKKISASGTNARVASDGFGGSVGLSGNLIVVGALAQDYDASGANLATTAGAAYIYSKDQGGTDNWGQVAKIVGTGTNGRVASDRFGSSVAIDGNVVVVGAPFQEYDASGANMASNTGAAYIFSKDQGGTDNWGQVTKIVATGTNARVANDRFGFSVDIDGDVAVVGVPFQDYDASGANSLSSAGAAYVYSKDQGGTDNWGQVKKIVATGTNGRNQGDDFGEFVAIDGDIIVVGADDHEYDTSGANSLSSAGAAFIYSKDQGGTDNWGQIKKITGLGTNGRLANDDFGLSVAISGDIIVVGAVGQDYDAGGANLVDGAGAAYVYRQNQGGTDNWGLVEKLAARFGTHRTADDAYGFNVAVSDSRIVVGITGQDYDASGVFGVNNGGKATIYNHTTTLECTSSAWDSLPSSNSGIYDAVVTSGTCVISPGSAIKSLTVSSGATATIASGTVTITEGFTNNGTISGAGSVTLGGTSAQTIAGTGTTNNVILNNSTGASITDSLKISGVYTHTAGTLTTNNKLRLVASGATTYGQIAGTGIGSISGQIIAEYFIPSSSSGKWRSISSPLTGVTIGDLADDILINYGTPSYSYSNVWALTESNGGSSSIGAWAPISSSTQSMNDNGFSIYLFDDNVSADITIDVQGTYTDGDYTTAALTRTGSIGDTSGWHLLRNPWPSNYNHTGTITNLGSNTIYVTEGNTFRDWNGTTGTLSSGVIPPFHAFYAEISSNSNTLTLLDANRTTSSSANYHDKNGLINYVAVKATGENDNWDETRVYQDDKAENGFDNFDAKKRVNGEGAPTIYTLVEDKKVSINLIKNIPTKGISFPLMFSAYESGKYILSFTEDNLESDVEIVLEDLETKKMHKASTGKYEFTYDKANGAKQRFVLHYKRKSGTSTSVTETANQENIFVSSQNKEVHISFGNEGDYIISVYDLMGREMYNGTTKTNGGTTENINLEGVAAGYYIVNISSQNSKQTFKVFLR